MTSVIDIFGAFRLDSPPWTANDGAEPKLAPDQDASHAGNVGG